VSKLPDHWPLIKLAHLRQMTAGARDVIEAVRGEFPIEEQGDLVPANQRPIIVALDDAHHALLRAAEWYMDEIARQEKAAGGKLERHP